MSDPQPNSDAHQPIVRKQERPVGAWEYWSAYEKGDFQFRFPAPLFERLRAWARQDGIPPGELLIKILEEAVRQRGG
ncbi:MAG: hypothetical protein U0790_25950 [Isosphaeraceae bacterium]